MALQAPNYIQDGSTAYTAEDFRYNLETSCSLGEGVSGLPDYRVTQKASGANMSIDVAAGIGWVRGDTSTRQGLYHVVNDATVNVVISTADSTDPRIDQIVLRIYDDSYDGSGDFEAALEVLEGTPTAGADLDDRLGAATLPDTAMLLADVLVAAGATSITDSVVRDRRRFRDVSQLGTFDLAGATGISYSGTYWGTYPLGDAYDSTILMPHQYLPQNGDYKYQVAGGAWAGTSGGADTWWAIPVMAMKRIVGANTFRWQYKHGASATVDDYRIALYDAQGYLLADTGTVAFTGAANTIQDRAESVTAFDLEPGLHYLLFGLYNVFALNPPYTWFYPTDTAPGRSHALLRDHSDPPSVLVAASPATKISSSDGVAVPVMQLSAE